MRATAGGEEAGDAEGDIQGLGYQQAVDVTGEGPVTEAGALGPGLKVLDLPSTENSDVMS